MASCKSDFADRDAVLIGASTDTDFVHFAWRKSDERLAACDFPWIADNQKKLANALGIVDADEGVAFRATFIVDPHNVIQHVTVNGLNSGPQPAEALRVLDALQTDELCPCNWQEGEEVLKPGRLIAPARPIRDGARGSIPSAPLSFDRRRYHVAQGLRRHAARLCQGHPAQRRLAAQRPDARRPAQIRPAARLRARLRLQAARRGGRGRGRRQAHRPRRPMRRARRRR